MYFTTLKEDFPVLGDGSESPTALYPWVLIYTCAKWKQIATKSED